MPDRQRFAAQTQPTALPTAAPGGSRRGGLFGGLDRFVSGLQRNPTAQLALALMEAGGPAPSSVGLGQRISGAFLGAGQRLESAELQEARRRLMEAQFAEFLAPPERFVPVLDAEGNVIGQQSTKTGRVVADPTVQRPDRTLVEVADDTSPTGTRLVPRGDAAGLPGPPGSGTDISIGPDGQVQFRQGRGVGLQPTSTTLNRIQDDLRKTRAQLERVDSIAGTFRPEFLELGSRFGAAFTAGREKLGLDVEAEDRQQLQQFTAFRRNTVNNLNQVLRDMSGAAITPQEAERLAGALPNAGTTIFNGDSPTEFRAKMNEVIRDLNRAQARLTWSATNGLSFEQLPLTAIDQIITNRRAQLEGEGMSPEEATQVLAREFGIR